MNKNIFNEIYFLLNNNEISRIKRQIYGKYKGLSILDCINKLNCFNIKIEKSSIDIKYNILLKQ